MPKYFIEHIHLTSPDPEKTANFYEKMFSAERVSDIELAPGRTTINLNLGGMTLLISNQTEGTPAGLGHFGISTDDLDQSISDLKTAGVSFTMEKTVVRPDFALAFLNAPEDVSIELQQGSL